jgi:excinuclease ABC subunit A
VPDDSLSINQGAIEPWSSPNSQWYKAQLDSIALMYDFSLSDKWSKLSKKVQKIVLYGTGETVQIRYTTRRGRTRLYNTDFEGVIPMLYRRYTQTDSPLSKDKYEEYMREKPCSACNGDKLKPEVLAVTIEGLSIADVCNMSIKNLKVFLEELKYEGQRAKIASEVLKEIRQRVGFLIDVGLEYLTLSRQAATLSGGEAQRIRLATQIGSGLVGVLYVLDEPSIGLHQRDNKRLITTLEKLRNLGNTLIVVEHDEETISAADWIVDIGPRAGEHGGKIVYEGKLSGIKKAKESITGKYLSGELEIAIPKERRKIDKEKVLKVVGARENNLKNIDVSFPLGAFVAVSGVSGSGKSTLVNSILYRALVSKLNRAKIVPGKHRRVEGIELVSKIIHVDQGPIGRTPRSNPATYTGVFDKIRTLFSELPESKARGYKQGRFSFNVAAGRCAACSGDGTLKIEMNFLPDVYVKCEVCKGARYNRETLEILLKGKSIADVLDMTIDEALVFFEANPTISRYMKTLVDVGLGYVRLGQSATTLSGGESQRVKLATELQKRTLKDAVYILDEPTTGLHFDDINKLLAMLQSLVDKGNTIIVIEHNLDVIKSADWVIEMGPSGGDDGGFVVTTGTPEQIAKHKTAPTAQFLKLSL